MSELDFIDKWSQSGWFCTKKQLLKEMIAKINLKIITEIEYLGFPPNSKSAIVFMPLVVL